MWGLGIPAVFSAPSLLVDWRPGSLAQIQGLTANEGFWGFYKPSHRGFRFHLHLAEPHLALFVCPPCIDEHPAASSRYSTSITRQLLVICTDSFIWLYLQSYYFLELLCSELTRLQSLHRYSITCQHCSEMGMLLRHIQVLVHTFPQLETWFILL